MSPDPAAGRREGWPADERRSEFVIRTHALARSYAGHPAVRGIDLEVARGEIFGLVGPDDAGKTTLIQMLCGILDPTGGRVRVLGCDLPRDAGRLVPRLGYMSQTFSLYGKLTVAENIEFFADLRGVPRPERAERTRRILEFSRLAPYVDRTAEKLSGGMKKKLALATTLLHDPDILILDEPTTGVDPLSRRDFWQIVFDFLREGVTVVVATPYMDEAGRCHRVALMHDGRILALDTPDGLKEDLIGRLVEIRSPDETRLLDAARGAPGVRGARRVGRKRRRRRIDRASLIARLFGVPFRGDPLTFAALSAAFLVSAIGTGVVIASVTRTLQQALLVAVFVLFPILFLSGTMTPIESMPELLQTLSRLSPLRYYNEALLAVFLKGSGLGLLWTELLWILGLGAVPYAGSYAVFRRHLV